MGIALADLPGAPKWRRCGDVGYYERIFPKPQGREFINPFSNSFVSVKNNVLWPSFPHPISLIESTSFDNADDEHVLGAEGTIFQELEKSEGGFQARQWYEEFDLTRADVDTSEEDFREIMQRELDSFDKLPDNKRNALLSTFLLIFMELQATGLPYPEKWSVLPVAYFGDTQEEVNEYLRRTRPMLESVGAFNKLYILREGDMETLVSRILREQFEIEC